MLLENLNKINIDLKSNLENNVNSEKQINFLDNNLGKAINGAIDIGLKFILPDSIENEIINVKNALLKGGLKEGINSAINEVINFGKKLLGIENKKFTNFNQIKYCANSKNIAELVSNSIDAVINKCQEKDFITSDIAKVLKSGKKVFFNNTEKEINKELLIQNNSLNKIDGYYKNWQEAYIEKDFNKMEKQYKKMQQEIEKTIPLDNIIKRISEINNVHTLIKNNNGNFDISEEQKELVKILA